VCPAGRGRDGLARPGRTNQYYLCHFACRAGLAWLAFLALVGFALRFLSLAIVARPDRLVIRNIRNTHRLSWDQVEEVYETPPPSPAVYLENPLFHQGHQLLVRLAEGSVISGTLYDSRMFRGSSEDRPRVVTVLNDLRRQYAGEVSGGTHVAGAVRDLLS
jgi:hypothetical protein